MLLVTAIDLALSFSLRTGFEGSWMADLHLCIICPLRINILWLWNDNFIHHLWMQHCYWLYIYWVKKLSPWTSCSCCNKWDILHDWMHSFTQIYLYITFSQFSLICQLISLWIYQELFGGFWRSTKRKLLLSFSVQPHHLILRSIKGVCSAVFISFTFLLFSFTKQLV